MKWKTLAQAVALPLLGAALVLALWSFSSLTWSRNLPSPGKTWEVSKPYVLAPFEKRGELDQGILRFAWYSLRLVLQGYALALVVGTPLGFLLGRSRLGLFSYPFDLFCGTRPNFSFIPILSGHFILKNQFGRIILIRTFILFRIN